MVGIIVFIEIISQGLADGLLDVLHVLVILLLTEESLDGELDALGHIVGEEVGFLDDWNDAIVIYAESAAWRVLYAVHLQVEAAEVLMLVGDDEAWLIYGIASNEATHQIADELFDDYIIVPDNLLIVLAAILRFLFLDRDFSLLQDSYLIERTSGVNSSSKP